MGENPNLAVDEQKRIDQHESVKGEVRQSVHDDIAREADRRAEPAQSAALAESLRNKAVREVRDTEVELDRSRTAARGSQIVDYLFFLAYGIISMEIVLEAIGARDSAGFKQFVDHLAAPLLLPFRGLMPDPSLGSSKLMLSYIVALAAYILLHLAVTGLFRLAGTRKTAI